MKYVFVTAYDDFSDYSLLERIYNKLFSNINKDELTFYCTVGSSGDNTCAKYIRRHGMKMIEWLNPRKGKIIKEERKNILVQCNYAVIINNGYHKGMFTAADQARKYVNGNIAIVHTDLQEILKSSNLDILENMKLIEMIEKSNLNRKKELEEKLWELTFQK